MCYPFSGDLEIQVDTSSLTSSEATPRPRTLDLPLPSSPFTVNAVIHFISLYNTVSIPSGTLNMSPQYCEGHVGHFSLPLVLLLILSRSPLSCCVPVLWSSCLKSPFSISFEVGLPVVHLLVFSLSGGVV